MANTNKDECVVKEGIRIDSNNLLSFGNFNIKEKCKVDGFSFEGDLYKVKTHDEVTRLEKNGQLLIETVPGAALFGFQMTADVVSFTAYGKDDTQVTIELEPETEYKLLVDGMNIGTMKSKISGKVNFSLELGTSSKEVKVEKM